MVCLGPAVCVLLMTAVVCVGAGAVGCVCIGACGGAGCRKRMCSGRMYFGLLNCSHSVYKVMN